MLKNINPILSPELLSLLRAMGHNDDIAIVDGNYPAAAHAKRLIRADGLTLVPVVDAVLSVLPIDESDKACVRTYNYLTPQTPDPIHTELDALFAKHGEALSTIEPDRFYQRARDSYVIIATSEPALYANVIMKKGVIKP